MSQLPPVETCWFFLSVEDERQGSGLTGQPWGRGRASRCWRWHEKPKWAGSVHRCAISGLRRATTRCKWLTNYRRRKPLESKGCSVNGFISLCRSSTPWSLVLCTPEALDPPQGIASSCPSPATLILFAFFPVIFPFPEGQQTYQGDRFTPLALWLSKYQQKVEAQRAQVCVKF